MGWHERHRLPDRRTCKKTKALLPPVWTGHADFTNPFEFARFVRDAAGLEFDVTLEGKAKDVSLAKLRPDLLRYAPDVAGALRRVPGGGGGDGGRGAALEAEHDPAAADPDVDEAA